MHDIVFYFNTMIAYLYVIKNKTYFVFRHKERHREIIIQITNHFDNHFIKYYLLLLDTT